MPFTAALAGDLSLLADTIWSAAAALAERSRRQAYAVEVAVGADAVTKTASAWRSIEDAGGASTAFQTHEFARHAAEAHERRGETPRVVSVRADGQPMVVFPTVTRNWSGVSTIQFLGDPLIQYGDVLAAPNATAAHLDAAWRAAADPTAGRLVYLRKVRADARIAPLLAAQTRTLAEHEAPFVDVRADLSAKHAKDIRRSRRRLAAFGDIIFEVLEGPDARPVIAEALDTKRSWLAARSLQSSVIGDEDWEQAVLALAQTPQVRVATLRVDGRMAAIEIGFVHDDRWYSYLGTLAPDFARGGPGQVQIAEAIAHCRDAGLASYDLLSPADDYKRRMAHGAVVVRDHAVPLGYSGRVGMLLARLVPVAKELAGCLPPPVRRALSGLRPR